MSDTREVNQQYLWTWLDNTENVRNEAIEIAERGDAEELREFITKTLREAPRGSGEAAISDEMSNGDLDTIDWDEMLSDLLV